VPWARPGGVAAAVAWADARLAESPAPADRPLRADQDVEPFVDPAASDRPRRGVGKSVPPFQDHEGTVLAIVGADDPSLVPTVLAADRATGTVLLEDVSGEDQWEASAPVLHEMERRWVRTQARWVDRTDRLPEARIPDWRADAFRGSVAAMLERPEVRSSVEASVVVALDGLVADLPRRLSDLDACGVPETIVHGDFHAGNRRSDGTSLVLLDWGDAGLGHPMLDLTTFLLRVPEKERGSEGWGFDSVPAR
jgi:Phosphotransferase enzyme family